MMLNVGCSMYDWRARVIESAMMVVRVCHGLVVRFVIS